MLTVVTGATGFIGSVLIHKLKNPNIIAVDKFNNFRKNRNLNGALLYQKIDREDFINWLDENYKKIDLIYHLGARTDTLEFNKEILYSLNTEYSKNIWRKCVKYGIPLIFASSAATYGLGENGFADDEKKIELLKPLNLYGQSKQDFDLWAWGELKHPPFWAGLKFFNVYGPNEYHKEKMASTIYQIYHQVVQKKKVMLFRSHDENFENGHQKRDFIFVEDIVDVCIYLSQRRPRSGIYNVGSGKASSFLDIAKTIFRACACKEAIEFIDIPLSFRDKYQYFTQADMHKLINTGYGQKFHSMEEGIKKYVGDYLMRDLRYYSNKSD